MKKFPFTPEGVQGLQQELYALPDPELLAEAASLENDMQVWLKDKFELNSHQVSFIDGLSAQFVSYASLRTSFAFSHRLPIYLNVPEFKGDVETMEKIIKPSDKTSLSSNDEASGELIFDVSL
ncbi:MAG: hypothetical protein EOO88_19950 [Pedobacter sp.]|nr:MAG: hypothetical protein EOO88_19950 [Pedobacter sp.]